MLRYIVDSLEINSSASDRSLAKMFDKEATFPADIFFKSLELSLSLFLNLAIYSYAIIQFDYIQIINIIR